MSVSASVSMVGASVAGHSLSAVCVPSSRKSVSGVAMDSHVLKFEVRVRCLWVWLEHSRWVGSAACASCAVCRSADGAGLMSG